MRSYCLYLYNWNLRILDQNFVDVAKDDCFLKQPPRRTMEDFSRDVEIGQVVCVI